jgi:hypothetical protein
MMPDIVKSTLEEVAEPSVIAQAEFLVQSGSHYWFEDFAGVWGLIRSGTDKQADLIVYTADGDFETAADFG